ncbi:unnamed protein product [Chilo suppressalis]|uniref:Circadian clock-controlled protein n=1 Tax=Chilo suppressalis TaxID=168631 RepID=A0ABN8B397_CHISP|nr:hypothetical protein evm_006116 [Chilo suppressalis]CAH0399972.1 unnamed protein product [Chilo suppressalis]
MNVHLLFVALFAVGANAGSLPPYFSACSASDPHLNQCIERVISAGGAQFADGLPALGVAPLDPLKLGKVVVDNPALKLVFTDTVVTGLKGFKLNSYKMNAARNKATIDFVANVTLKAHYVMDGQVLILPIRGDGPAKIKINGTRLLQIQQPLQWKQAAGGDDPQVHEPELGADNAGDRAARHQGHHPELRGRRQRLLRQSAGRGATPVNDETIHRVINENWEPVIRDIAPVAFEHIIRACVDECNKLFAAVPAAELLRP